MMRIVFIFYCFATISVGCGHVVLAQIQVSSQGDTILSETFSEMKVQVKIKSQEIDIGKPSAGRPEKTNLICTYSKYPCSIVVQLEIFIDGEALFIPHSAYCDLADLTRAEMHESKKGAVLTLYGGDASESYIVQIEFNANQVSRRILSSAMSPGQPLQETIYHIQTIGN